MRSCMLFLFGLLSIPCMLHAQAGKYAPFVVNTDALTATLQIKGDLFTDKYAAVFKKHKLDPGSTTDWNSLLEEVAAMKETDLLISKDVSFEANEEAVELTAVHIDDLEQMLKALRLVIASPQTVDAFLIQYEAMLRKTKK